MGRDQEGDREGMIREIRDIGRVWYYEIKVIKFKGMFNEVERNNKIRIEKCLQDLVIQRLILILRKIV